MTIALLDKYRMIDNYAIIVVSGALRDIAPSNKIHGYVMSDIFHIVKFVSMHAVFVDNYRKAVYKLV